MFCDLIGSTALSSRLDPEDLREVIRTYQACVATTIQQFDGFIARYVGDGVLIYFGWPEARETDAERAVRAGLAVAAAVSAAPVSGEPLQVRIGIATGLVVIGEPIGSGDSRQQTAVGETPNLAARLQGLAGPDQVVIDAATRRQIGGLFECQDLGTVELKGLPVAVPAWQVLSENRTLGQFEALRSGATPLVGRDEEMELLLRRWAQAKAGNGRVVLISAEPGVGKSRLAEALAERIAAEPHIRLRYFCSPHHQDSALYPVIAQMERAAGFAHADGPAARLAKLQALLAATAPPMEDVALIAELHALPSADLAPPLDVTPQRKKEKTFEALLRQVEGLSRQQPVLMMFDDLHWIDPSSRELLDRVIERVADWPVLLLAMFRPEFQPPWTGQPHVTMLTLARLDRRDTAAMVANVAGNAALPPEIVEEIAERTDGVPLFVEELTKAVLESGAQGAGGAVRRAASGVVGAGDLARLADGAAGSAGTGRQGGCANRRGDRPRVRVRAAGVRHRSAGAATSRGARSADERRPVVRPRHAAGIQLHLQARAGAGCGLRHLAAQPAPAAAQPHRRDPRRPLSGDRAGATRAVGPALRGSRAGGTGGRLLAEGRSAGAGALGDDGSGRPVAEGVGRAGRSAGRPVAPATGAGPANRARIGTDCHERLVGGGSGRDPRPSARAG